MSRARVPAAGCDAALGAGSAKRMRGGGGGTPGLRLWQSWRRVLARAPERAASRQIGVWLLVCAALVAGMICLGGLTRLTRSGLSIVEWQPITGVLPPLSGEAWQQAFSKYRETPEFRLVNAHIGLSEFQRIYWVEYAHRLLGRGVALAFALPMLLFSLRGLLPARTALRLWGWFLLGGVQGVVGWLMVKSGLSHEARVSHFRLALHLLLGLGLFAGLLWSALSQLSPPPWCASARGDSLGRVRWRLIALALLVALTAVWGALTAGLHGGLAAPTFPSLNGAWIPPELSWRRAVTDPLGVHFAHRALAGAVVVVSAAVWLACRRAGCPALARMSWGLVIAVVLQVVLGALTVLHFVPIALASLHQANAIVLLGVIVCLLHTSAGSGRPA